MRSRFSLLLKKRGRRRTGSPLLAASGAIASDLIFLSVGVGGAIAMLRERDQWAAWALAIPLSLAAIGGVGLWRTLRRVGASPEWVRWRADRPWLPHRLPSVLSASPLPSVESATDSPGVRMQYRLPIDGARGWRVVGMALICVLWNGLVGFFLVEIVSNVLQGNVNWPITLLVAPLAFAGVGLGYELMRDAWTATGVGVTRVEVSDLPMIPGGTYRCVVIQAGQLRVRSLVAALVCEEVATYLQGTDSRVATAEVYRNTLLRERRFDVDPARPFEAEFEIEIPADAMHSFRSTHNEVAWSVEVQCLAHRWPSFRRRFPLCVYPAPAQPASATKGQLSGAAT
ncbi:hypothetical protein Pla175_34410 [Pirellulimonas nuda]|uniref:Uncharacterized protein n=1 Tax=Pirellulimonas nuda TaxID=2528009 RepID=A0A518DF28_9BACT|nr:hypothetical protein [Pirellulimonas nuda]QDU90042.1 hypothetical protein Pla175_34410 [Pirellulimonas nuda]